MPITLVLGLAVIIIVETLLFADVAVTGRGAIHTAAGAAAILNVAPTSILGDLARIAAVNITPIAWSGYLLALDGILTMQQSGSPVRRRPHHFALLCFASVFIWCVFDFLNFHNGMYAWVYIGMPVDFSEKYIPYLLAFGSVVPGMLMSGQVMLNLGWFNWARSPAPSPGTPGEGRGEGDFGRQAPLEARNYPHPSPLAGSRRNRSLLPEYRERGPDQKRRNLISVTSLLAGAAMLAWPILHPTPITNLTLWTSFVFLLDPINDWLGRPSMFRDWRHGWYGRTLAAFAGGLLCGFLWEFWNYWALSKWTYDLPFLGSWGKHHYFEMPLPGLLGFLPFGLECWVMWQTIRIPLDGLAEPLPDARTLL
jgi:hypothetical protein